MSFVWKRLVSLALLTLLLPAALPTGALAAAGDVYSTPAAGDVYSTPAAGQKELLLNNEFEAVEDNTLQYWALTGGSWGAEPGAAVVQDVTYGGSGNAVRLATTEDVRDVYLTHKVRTIPGAVYQVSFWVNASAMASGAGIKFTLAYTDHDGASAGSYNPTYSIKQEAVGGWVQYVHHFTAGGVKNGLAHFRLRLLGGASTVYADNVSLYAIEVPEEDSEEEEEPVQIVPDFTWQPPAEGAANLLENNGFEDLKTTGGLVSWTASGGKWNQETGASVIEKTEDPEHVYSGDRAIRITNNLYVTRRYVTQWVHLEPGAMYQASVWVNVAEIGSARIRYSMAYWDAAHKKNPGGYQTGSFRYTNRKGEWVQYVIHFEALEKGDNEVEFRIDLYGGDGIVYFDEASLYMIEPRPKMDFSANEVLYYTESKTGIMTAKLHCREYPETAGGTVDFRIKDGDTVIEEKLSASTEGDDTARYVFDLSLLEIGKEYTAEAVLKDAGGNSLETQTETIKRYLPRPRALTEEGFYKEQVQGADGTLTDKLDGSGNPVYLDVMIAYTRPDDLSLLSAQGVTAYIRSVNRNTANDNLQTELDNAARNGLKVLVGLYPNMKPAGHPDNTQMSTYYINKYKNHPAVLGWAVLDEPSAYFKELELIKLMEDSYTLIRSLDPVHPVYAVEATTEFLPLIGRYVDILASDPYPYNTNPIAGRTATYMRAAAEAVSFAKPTCSIVQARSLNEYFPTVDEVRHMYYEALFEGAGMLGFYAFNNASGSLNLSQTDRWEGHVRFGNGEQQEAFDAFVYRKYPVFCESAEIGADAWYAAFVRDGALYMVILNMDEKNRTAAARTVDIPLISDGGTVSVNGYTATLLEGEGTAEITGTGSTISVPLAENAAVIYRITPNTATDFSGLAVSPFRDLGRCPFAAEQIRALGEIGILKGITETAYGPARRETVERFIASLSALLGISAETLTADFGGNGQTELSRADMMRLVQLALRAAGMDEEIVADAAALLRTHMLAGNIDKTASLVTRAEAALVLARLLEWKENGAEGGTLYNTDAAEAVSLLLSAGTETETGWYSVTETADGALAAVSANCDGTFSVPVSGEAVQTVYGDCTADFSEGRLQVEMTAGSTVILRVYTAAPFGLYENNTLLTFATGGTVTIKNAKGTGQIALYEICGGRKELLLLTGGSLEFSPREGAEYVLSAIDWAEALVPQNDVYTIRGRKK